MTGKKNIDVIPQTIPDDDRAVRSSWPETVFVGPSENGCPDSAVLAFIKRKRGSF